VPDFDPDQVPILHAATVMLVDDRVAEGDSEPSLHVLMVKRTAKLVFAPAAWVFPGGRVDPEDHIDQFDDVCDGLSDIEASKVLDVERGGLAWWIAACRETFEEAGLLLASNPDALESADVVGLRNQVREEESLFLDLLIEHGLRIDATCIEEVARFRAGEFEMISPTVRMVDCLTRYACAADVMAAARERRPYQRVRVIDPAGQYIVVLPGEEGYETAELEVESGWVRF